MICTFTGGFLLVYLNIYSAKKNLPCDDVTAYPFISPVISFIPSAAIISLNTGWHHCCLGIPHLKQFDLSWLSLGRRMTLCDIQPFIKLYENI